jgi:hypothetical protein
MDNTLLIQNIKAAFKLDTIISLDFETFYGKGYGLKNKTYAEYIMDDRFRAQMLGVGEDDEDIEILDAHELDEWAANIRARRLAGERIGVIAQNTQFDAAILCWRFGIVFDFYFDAMLLSRLRFINRSAALKAHAERIWPEDESRRKGDELHKAEGIEDLHSVPGLFEGMSTYCTQDVALTRDIVLHHWATGQVPMAEWYLMHITLRGCVEPQVWINQPLLDEVMVDDMADKTRKVIAASDYLVSLGKPPVGSDVFASNDKYKALLADFGARLPYKLDPETYEMKPALGKTDPEYVKFQQDNPQLEPLFAARETVKSTIATSRAKRLQATANLLPLGGFIPFPLNYHKAHTGRWSGGEKLNLQNLQRGSKHRLCLTAKDGYVITVRDLSGIEMRMNLWFCEQDDLLELVGKGGDIYCKSAEGIYAHPVNKKEHPMERQVGKVACIARDSLVLTEHGWTPIQNVSTADFIWDGEDFVSHDGPVCKGEKEVITYGELTATIDHPVFTNDGRLLPFGVAASRLEAISRRGIHWETVWNGADNRWRTAPEGQEHPGAHSLHDLRGGEIHQLGESEKREDQRLSELLANDFHALRSAGAALRCDHSALQQPHEPQLRAVRSAWDTLYLLIESGVYTLHNEVPTASDVQKGGDRPDRQQWELHAWELTLGNAARELQQQVNHTQRNLAGQGYTPHGCDARVSALLSDLHVFGQHTESLTARWAHFRGDTDPFSDPVFSKATREVWDIINAGPRNRFEVSGTLVHNCLGLGYQMSWKTFQATMAGGPMGMDPIFFPDSFCKQVKDAYDRDNPMIKQMWAFLGNVVIPAMCDPMCDMDIGRHGCVKVRYQKLILPSGRELQYPSLHCHAFEHARGMTYEYRYDDGTRNRFKEVVWKRIYGGALLENIIQAIARDVIADHMIKIEDLLCETASGWVIGSVHDEILSMVLKPLAEQRYEQMGTIMATPPHWCFDLPLASEGGWDTVYSK